MPFKIDPSMPFGGEVSDAKLEASFTEPYNAWKREQTPQTRSALLKAVDPVIGTALKSYGGPSAGSPVLRSQARRMALEAFNSYDPAKGALKSHLLSQLRRLHRVGAQQAQIIRLPEQVALQLRQLEEAEHELHKALGRDASDMEIADYTGISPKRLAYIRQARPVTSSGQLEAVDERQEAPPSEVVGDVRSQDAWEDFVYADLNPTDQLIYDMLRGRHGRQRKTTQEVASHLRITPGAVSQRAKKIQQLLDERHTLGIL